MQCGELMYRRAPIMTQGSDSTDKMPKKSVIRETIHSGHFMVSDFEAEAQDDEDLVAVPVPDEELRPSIITPTNQSIIPSADGDRTCIKSRGNQKVSLFIDSSLTKLFQCMTVAYRQKLTSPKWNRFKGIRIRWKDKIRLNNVIWRCWHMQCGSRPRVSAVVRKESTFVCQFASPLDVDMHNKPEAVVLEGKYWKRKLATVTAEYKKWRMFYKNKIMGWTAKDGSDMLGDIDMFEWQPNSNESANSVGSMMVDEDYMDLMSDTLFTTISQPFPFPNPREIARGAGLADLIQPGLVQLQPNLDDFMDTLEPLQSLHDLLYPKLASVPEETIQDENNMFRPVAPNTLESNATNNIIQSAPSNNCNYGVMGMQQESNLQYTAKIYTQAEAGPSYGIPPRQLQPVEQQQQQQQQQSTPTSMQQATTSAPQFYFTAPNPMLSQDPMTLQMNLVQDSMAPPSKLPQTSTKSNDGFAIPHVNKMKRRSHSGSALLSNSRANQAQQQHHHQQMSLSSTGLNLMSGEGCSSALLAQLLQPSTLPSASSSVYHHVKPILPAPAPSQQQQAQGSVVLSTTVLVASPPTLAPKPTVPSSSDLTPQQRPQPPEMRRVCHINAEQKRRCNIQNGFQTLQGLIPHLSQSPTSKLSKAALLHKGADYIRQLQSERGQLKDEISTLRLEIDALNASISNVQALLPASGAPISHQRSTRMREMFDEYVRQRTLQNWKFWIFSVLMQPLLASYSAAVSTNSIDELYRSVLQWVEQHCSLVDLRPAVLNALRKLCTATDILTDPSKLPDQATRAVSQGMVQTGNPVAGPGSPPSPLPSPSYTMR